MAALFVERLTVIDFSYLHPERGLLGESWIVDLELAGELDDQGMVFDFGPVKKLVKAAIDRVADHKLLVPAQLMGLSVKEEGEDIDLDWDSSHFPFKHRSPTEAVLLLDTDSLTCSYLAEYLQATVAEVVPGNVVDIRLNLYPEAIDGAFYHYSHGLKKHLGDCQRIAHGHRSKIRVLRNDGRDEALEEYLAGQFRDTYLVTREDMAEDVVVNQVLCHHLAYQSQQGDFSITLPVERCVVLETDSTVELIAAHLLKLARERHPADEIQVYAYEGVAKGAIARSS